MKKHLFLTGEKGVGKSTLLNRLLAYDIRSRGGFRTKRIQSPKDGLYYVYLLQPGEFPSERNVLFCCTDPDRFDSVERFEKLGCAALSKKCELYLMDELGPHEENAELFQKRVYELLDGEIPILGVLQKAESRFLSRIASHPAVEVIEVTLENRDQLPDMIKWAVTR